MPCAVSARAGKERFGAVCSFSSCRQGAFVSPFRLVRTRSIWLFVDFSSDLGEAFLAIFISRSLDRVIEEVFGEEVVHCDGDG